MQKRDWHYWDQFLNAVADAIVELGSPKIIWYRGVSSASHTLRPSLLRFKNGAEKERELFDRFAQISRGSQFSLAPGSDEWDVLFQMQHFGVPTRLLDWSEVFGIAVFFATLPKPSNDSHIYVLNPRLLNEKAGKDTLLDDFDRQEFKYRSIFWDGKPFKPSTPMAINPAHSNPRLAAQTGRFTIHGVDTRPIDGSASDCVRRIKLPLDAIPAAYEFLNMAGLNELRVFPDVGGAAPFLRNLVGLT